MKKLILTITFLGLLIVGVGGCNEPKKTVVKKEKLVVKKMADISLGQSDIKLGEYYALNKKELWNNLAIIYSADDRNGYIIASGVRADLKKKKNIESKIIKDSDITKEILVNHNLLLIGNTKNNRVLKEVERYLPIKINNNSVKILDKTYNNDKLGITYFYPNLYNLNNSMIVMMAENGMGLKMYDFQKSDIIILNGISQVMPVNFKEIAYANFDTQWNVKKIDEVDPKLLNTGENVKLELGDLKKYNFPEWAKGKFIYEIFLRSFYDTNNDGVGDLKGLEEKLDYLKELGVDIIWLTPIFESPSYHGYNINDYFKINSDFGTMEDYRSLVKEIHKKEMHIILDLPLNHCSNREPHFKNSYNNPDSKYDKWFYYSNLQNTIYHDWFFKSNNARRESINSRMPAWNTNNMEVIEFHNEILKFWFDPNKDGNNDDGVDGFRLDYVKGPSHDYWKILRQKVKKEKENVLLLGEAWVDLEEMKPFFDNEFDALFDFTMQGSMTTGVMGDLKKTIQGQKEFPKEAQFARFLSNHDLDRFPTYIPIERVKIYASLLFTLPGMPTLYYGDEIGAKGDGADGDEGRRRPLEWYKDNQGRGMTRWTSVYNKNIDGISVEEQENDNKSMLEHIKKLSRFRKKYLDIFKDGEIELINVFENKNGKERSAKRVMAYFIKKDLKKMLVILNFGNAGEYIFNFKGIDEEKYSEVFYNQEKNLVIKNGRIKMELEKLKTNVFFKEK
ncbi:MAG: hypothetical protein B6I28_04030 [Fusobacteriia bacterium 4572_132]|nr:MAG: hypothetical protein B6I28_04030 [Fusobacteriia bacterium 4572_132]